MPAHPLARLRPALYLAGAFLLLTAELCPGDQPTAPTAPPAPLPPPAVLAPAPSRAIVFDSDMHSQSGTYGLAIFGMNADGSGIVQISSPNGKGDEQPELSPDGTRIVFVRTDTLRRQHVALMNADGTNVRLLTNLPNFDDTGPTWTPDGQQIVFSRDEVFETPSAPSQLYIMNADGSGLRRIFAAATRSASQPDVDPSGTQVAYTSFLLNQPSQIRVIGLDGSNDRSVAQNNGGGYLRAPTWHPDGTRILFSGEGAQGSPSELYTVRPNATDVVQITNTPTVSEQSPTYNDDGSAIVFVADAPEGRRALYRMSGSGGSATRLTATAGAYSFPSWGAERYTLEITPDLQTITLAQTVQLTATRRTATGAPAPGGTTTWRALNAGFATVSSNGLVTPVAAGLALIEARNGNAYDTARVTIVAPAPVYTVRVSPRSTEVLVGLTVQLSATVTASPAGATPAPATTWRSLDAGVASVSGTGLVSGLAAGTARVVAQSGSAADTASVLVSAAPVVYVLSVTPRLDSITLAQTLQLTATRRTSAGVSAPGGTTTWATLNAGIATVSGSGLVTPVAAGTARIVATNGQAADTATVIVLPPVSTGPVRLNLSATARSSLRRLASNASETIPDVIRVGDGEQTGDRTVQGFAQYGIASIPAGATITSATLSVLMNQSSVTGAPFALGPLSVYQVAAIALTDAAPAGGVPVASAFSSFTSVDVASLIRDARAAGRTTITFHFRFRDLVNGNGQTDTVDASVGGLEINYTP